MSIAIKIAKVCVDENNIYRKFEGYAELVITTKLVQVIVHLITR